jgi:hypothetical protein
MRFVNLINLVVRRSDTHPGRDPLEARPRSCTLGVLLAVVGIVLERVLQLPGFAAFIRIAFSEF